MPVKMTCQDWMEQRHTYLHLPSLQMLKNKDNKCKFLFEHEAIYYTVVLQPRPYA